MGVSTLSEDDHGQVQKGIEISNHSLVPNRELNSVKAYRKSLKEKGPKKTGRILFDSKSVSGPFFIA
jgi:hypothetical protein